MNTDDVNCLEPAVAVSRSGACVTLVHPIVLPAGYYPLMSNYYGHHLVPLPNTLYLVGHTHYDGGFFRSKVLSLLGLQSFAKSNRAKVYCVPLPNVWSNGKVCDRHPDTVQGEASNRVAKKIFNSSPTELASHSLDAITEFWSYAVFNGDMLSSYVTDDSAYPYNGTPYMKAVVDGRLKLSGKELKTVDDFLSFRRDHVLAQRTGINAPSLGDSDPGDNVPWAALKPGVNFFSALDESNMSFNQFLAIYRDYAPPPRISYRRWPDRIQPSNQIYKDYWPDNLRSTPILRNYTYPLRPDQRKPTVKDAVCESIQAVLTGMV